MQVTLVIVTIAVYPNSRFLTCFWWENLALPVSKFRTFTSCKFITSFKIRVKQNEQEHLQSSNCCYTLLACFSFLCSFFPFLPFFPSFPLLTIYWFCGTYSVLLWFCNCQYILHSVLCYVCGSRLPRLLILFLFPASFWAAVSFHSALCAKTWSQID